MRCDVVPILHQRGRLAREVRRRKLPVDGVQLVALWPPRASLRDDVNALLERRRQLAFEKALPLEEPKEGVAPLQEVALAWEGALQKVLQA